MANTSSETFRRFTEDEEIYKPFCLVKIEDKLNIFWELAANCPHIQKLQYKINSHIPQETFLEQILQASVLANTVSRWPEIIQYYRSRPA